MKVLFIRHGIAMDRGDFKGSDMDRPLTKEGRKKAATAFAAVARLYPELSLVLSSEAVRALQTAKILAQCAGAKVAVTSNLNPGSDARKCMRSLADLPGQPECVAVVGHEPDFSRILADVVAGGTLRVEVKKASCVEVDVNTLGKGRLQAFFPPRPSHGSTQPAVPVALLNPVEQAPQPGITLYKV